MAVEFDSTGKRYVEVGTLPNERLRLTLVPGNEAGYGVESVRLQIRDEPGHLRQGPEVPVATIGATMLGILELLFQR